MPQNPRLLALPTIQQPITTDQRPADLEAARNVCLCPMGGRGNPSGRPSSEKEQFCREIPRGRTSARVGRRGRAAQSILCAAPASVVDQQADKPRPQSKLCGKGRSEGGGGSSRPSVEVVVRSKRSAAIDRAAERSRVAVWRDVEQAPHRVYSVPCPPAAATRRRSQSTE